MLRRQFLLSAFAAGVAPRLLAQAPDPWSALRAGGVAILLRHAQTVPGLGDPPGFRLGDCATQRNLSEEGRNQSRRIGAALAAQGVQVEHVLSSQWCRCLDTARLAFPRHAVEAFPALNSFFDDRSAEPGRTREARARIAAIRSPSNVALVTHHVNILALTGLAVGAGEAVLMLPPDRVLGRLSL